MTPFEPTGPEVPIPPFDIPTPDIPAADFVKIGAQQAKGAAESSAPDTWLKKILAWINEVLKVLLGWIPAFLGEIVGDLLGLLDVILAYVVSFFGRVRKNAGSGVQAITAAAVTDLFGVATPDLSTIASMGSAQADAFGEQLAAKVISALANPGGASGPASLAASQSGVDRFLARNLALNIEGWANGAIFELISLGQVKTFTELPEIVSGALGLGRISGRALRPYIKAFVADPATWDINNRYRPRLSSEAQAVRMFVRGLIDRATLEQHLGYQGYTTGQIENLITMERAHLSPGQLANLIAHNAIDQTTAIDLLKAQGFDDFTAASALQIPINTSHDAWIQKFVSLAVDAFGARKIDQPTFEGIVNNSGLPDAEKQIILLTGDLRQQINVTHLSLGEALQLVEAGLWDVGQYHDLAILHGYSESDATDLELLALVKMKKMSDAAAAKAALAAQRAQTELQRIAAAKAKAAAAAAAVEAHGLSIAKYEALVKDGEKTMAQYRAFLALKGIAPDNIDALATELARTIARAAAAAAAKAAAAATVKAKHLSLANLEMAVKAGTITITEYTARLVQAGLSQANAQFLTDLLSAELATAAAKAKAKADAKALAAIKHVDLAQEERAVRIGFQTVADYSAFLTAHGFAPEDASILIAELNAQLAADAAAKATKAAASAKLTSKGLSLSQLERAVRAGVASIQEYQATLAAEGFTAQAVAELTSLLQLQMESDQHSLAATGKASGLPGQMGESLANLARAVKLGVLPMAAYTTALSRTGLSAADQQTMQLTLAAAIAATSKTKVTVPTISKMVASIGLSLGSLESAVKTGRLTFDEFTNTLASAGVKPAQYAPIVTLLKEEIANAAAIKALEAAAAKAAKVKGLSLSQERAALKQGVLTIEDYEAFVLKLGFNLADTQILVLTEADILKITPPADLVPPAMPLPT